MGNRCARTPSCRKLWSRICCCCSNINNTNGQARSKHGSKGMVFPVTRIEIWEEKVTEAKTNGKIVSFLLQHVSSFSTIVTNITIQPKQLVVNFNASWCVPCKKLEPIFRELASRYPSMIFVTIDVEELAEFSNEWNVEATPTVVFLKDGRQMDKLVGAETSELQKKTAAAADL
ncbi:unnamed protein product [Brassica rapa]|uniref:Thioredoxin domain-containing protein n=2 Tax=Brassica TaxID=3705 RepID=A0A8D9G2K3_BRACM|nr:unnamed protein product [Brassica napus]CAG7865726.1 unnamed protein product [Brassica rapa]